MKDLNKNFAAAIKDLVWLLDRGYPKKSSIELVGNRYGLSREERLMLYRGVFETETCTMRRRKKVSEHDVQKAGELYIDCYNLIITLRSYLLGRPVFRGLDGYVRDTAGVYGNLSYDNMVSRILSVITESLEALFGVSGKKTSAKKANNEKVNDKGVLVQFYLDAPVSRSGDLALDINKVQVREPLILKAVLSRNPDLEMLEMHDNSGGIIVSSDTVVIDRAKRIFDFAEWIISHRFKGEVFDLIRCYEECN